MKQMQAASAATTQAINAQAAAMSALKTASGGIGAAGAGKNTLGISLGSLAGIAGGLIGIGTAAEIAITGFEKISAAFAEVITAGDAMTAALNQIQATTGSTRAEAATTYDAITAAAIRTGTATADLTKQFTQMFTSLGPIGQTKAQVLDLATTLSELATISGTSGAASARAVRELNEGLAIGAINLRQLKIVGQDSPALLAALAKAVGVTTGALEAMAGAGELTSARVVAALEKMKVNVDATFNSIPRTLESSRTALTDSLNKLAADIDQTLGASQTLARWDRFWASVVSSLDHAVDSSITPKLAEANREVANFQAQLSKPTTATAFGLPDDKGAIRASLADAVAYRDGLQRQLDTQNAASDATARANKVSNDQAVAVEAASKAMNALGLEHSKTTPEIETLTAALARGQDVTVPYNDGVLHASQLLDLLRQKATPAAQAIATLNEELVKASAANLGGAQAKLTDILLKADPADKTGKGIDLSATQMDALTAGNNALLAAQGQKDVAEAQNRLKLAQAAAAGRAANDHGLAEANERIRQTREKFLKDHGSSPASVSEANQISTADTTAAQLTASSKAIKAAQPGINVLTDLKAKVAEATASIHGSGTAVAEWTEKLKTASPSVKAQGAAILAYAAQLDVATAAQKRAEAAQEALQRLQGNVAKASEDAATAQAESGDGARSALQRQIDNYKRQQDALVRTATADTSNPERGIEASSDAAKATSTEAQALIQQQVTANSTATLTIRKSWDDTFTGRRTAALAEVSEEGKALQQTIDLYVTNADDKKRLTDQTNAYITAKTQEALRQTESQTEKLGRTWADTTAAMDTATASFASGFVDATVDSLNGGKSAWSDYASSVIKELEKIALQAALSPLLKMAGGSTGGILGLLTTAATGIFGAAAGLPTAGMSSGEVAFVNAAGHHKGGIVGSEPTFMRNVPASLFANAPRYHTDGIVGGEVPAILQKGEGVFTAGQMEAIGSQAASMAALSQVVSAFSASRMTPPSDLGSSHGAPANYNYNIGSPANVGGGTSSTAAGPSSPPISINFHNQTGQNQTATASQPRFDGEKMIIDIVTKHVNQPGALRTAIRS
ncbi:tape measure protein [Lichenicola cladoniae]|uniref:Tape measure protein n=1 Tax=Lichenicola cladoniae TaxID=1484109 RepID=A0A6M8HRE7_9PROT|nr:tape measure protein [Lichenicola cladoniae]QKE90866.1 tape measure protein [Lichenicola cladoniae]